MGVCDGASENRRFIQDKLTHSSHSLCDGTMDIEIKDHYYDDSTGEPVYFMGCQVRSVADISLFLPLIGGVFELIWGEMRQTHLLKKLRNNLYRR